MDQFKKTVINTWGDLGQAWLEQLPGIITLLSEHWNLSAIKPVAHIRYNYVAYAIKNGTLPTVLKISCDQDLIRNEHRALMIFSGHASVKVIDFHREHNALLLERITPGTLLKTDYLITINSTIESYAKIARELAQHQLRNKPSLAGCTHVADWCQALNRITDPCIKSDWVNYGKKLQNCLLASMDPKYLCHGDLHLENIIQHKDNWVAIDPKGVMGELAFEVSAFDFIDSSEWDDSDELIVAKLLTRVTQLAKAISIDRDRLLRWLFLRSVISAQWFIEDNDDPSQMLRLITILYSEIS